MADVKKLRELLDEWIAADEANDTMRLSAAIDAMDFELSTDVIEELLAIAEASESLRALLRECVPRVRHSAGSTAQAIGMKYAEADYELLARIDAAMSELVPVVEGS